MERFTELDALENLHSIRNSLAKKLKHFGK